MPNPPSPARLARLNALAAEKLAGIQIPKWASDPELPRHFPYGPPADLPHLPDYAHSLDAVAELEALVRERGPEAHMAYSVALWQLCGGRDDAFACYTAPAWMRLVACLRACGVEEE